MTDRPHVPTEVDESALEMGIDPYEKNWMRLSILLLIGFFATVSISGFFLGIQVNGEDGEVDPRVVTNSGPWAEPGTRHISGNDYEAWVIAQTWSFAPREIVVPVGATVKINVTTPDVQHGFKITDTNVNMQVVPGQVSTLTYTFDEVGEFPYLCTEYCGQGHAAMFGVVKVVEPEDMPSEETAAAESDGTAATEGEEG